MGDVFEEHRRLLFSVAYRMLGTVADAEDILQDAWLRWNKTDRTDVADPRAYLVRIVTTTAIDRLRSAQVKREEYVGPWLPEPLLTSPDIAEDVELAESVSMAVLVVLETLSPLERAVFVLREVFGYSYTEVAETLDRSVASVRQVAHRAREHVADRRPRFSSGRTEQQQVTDRFLAAAVGGDLDQLMRVLAPDVVLVSDGGGKRTAPRVPVEGARKVARFLAGISDRPYHGMDPADWEITLADLNGGPGALITHHGEVITALSADVTDGRITTIYLVANPDKLDRLTLDPDVA